MLLWMESVARSGMRKDVNVSREYTPENITSLPTGCIFVFGSNVDGVHGKGAALTAKKYFGAIQGNPRGIQGRSYAIITKKNWRVEKSSTLREIGKEVQDFVLYANKNLDKKFYVVKIGSSLAGYRTDEIRGLFLLLKPWISENIILPMEYEVR